MKTNLLSIGLSLLSVVAIAQKKEIKDAGKAVEKGNYSDAKSHLQLAEPMLGDANDSYQADYYLYKGQAFLGTGKNIPVADLMTAAEAFRKAKEMGNTNATTGLEQVSASLVESAINDQKAEKFKEGADKLYQSYKVIGDTTHLYYAASFATQDKDYENAIKYYKELQDMGYTGVETQYVAINKDTGEEEAMNKNQRDLMVKSGQYTNPQDKVTDSKRGEIAKNIALIYITQGKNDEAIAAMESAKQENPDDLGLLQAEANMYYEMGNKDKYKEIMEGIVAKDPNNATSYYNLGVTSLEIGDRDAAIGYYKKALEIDPTMAEARLNIAAAILSQEADLVEQMNGLGMSSADTKKYDELGEQRKDIYKDALPYLEQVLENDPNNMEAMKTTMNIYYQLGQKEKADAIQQKINDATKK